METLKSRVLELLKEKSVQSGSKSADESVIQLDVTEGDVATLLGMSRWDATRALNALKGEGAISIEGSTIILRQ